MHFSCSSDDILTLDTDLLALGLFEDQLHDSPSFCQLDNALGGMLTKISQEEDFKAKQDQRLLLHCLEKIVPRRILLLGLGKRDDFQIPENRGYAARAVLAAIKAHCHKLAIVMPPQTLAREKTIQFLTEGVIEGHYRFDRYQSKESRVNGFPEEVIFPIVTDRATSTDQDKSSSQGMLAVAKGQIIAAAVNYARDLVNEPASVMTPAHLAECCQTLAKEKELECKIFTLKEIEKQKMRLLLAVAQGSQQEPRFVHLTYRPKGKEKISRRYAIIGKGITFDSGGLSLKPSPSMLDMKTDMAGAATVLGVMAALAELGCQAEIHALIPAAENMPSGASCKIGDIVTGLGGKSVEIVNTDAEGRLILADALAYAVKLQPDEIFDFATLTGGCVVALGPHIAGVMGNDRALIEHYLAAARRAGEEVWHLPLPERLKEQLKSPVADLKNSGDRWGSALVGGLFLKEFVGKTSWVHVDIAGPSSTEKDFGHIRKGGTGFGVSSMIEFVLSRDPVSI